MNQNVGTFKSTWTRVNGLRMHALISVDSASPGAQTIVLVHGSGLSGRYMIPTAERLALDFRVYVPDLPGFGDSDKPSQVFNVPELADWLSEWLTASNLDRAALLDNSFSAAKSSPTWPHVIPSGWGERCSRDQRRRRRSDPDSGSSCAGGRTSVTTRTR
jgi:hypothetical protein